MVESKHYERSNARRFVPSEFERTVVTIDCVDVDKIAQNEIKAGYWSRKLSLCDRHGYPAA